MRPPREDYVRVTVGAFGYTFEPAVEYRDGDLFGQVAHALRGIANKAAYNAVGIAQERSLADFSAYAAPATASSFAKTIAEQMPDAMSVARTVAERIARQFPDRAYFVEVWQEGREGFAQVFQPFGVPRNP